MEDIVTCSICLQVFNSSSFSFPKMLECGHTFCSPCLTKLFQNNPSCPNCRAEIKGTESSLPINYNTLKAVDFYKSKAWPEKEIIASIEDMKKKCMERKEIISEKMTQMMSSLEVLGKCLAKLEEMTVSETQKVDILHKMDEDLKKIDDDPKSSVSIFLSSFEDPKAYLTEIYKRVENGEKVFTVRKIEEEIKYGEVSISENKLFFHSLSLSEVPTNSSLIWFEELKQCAYGVKFNTFIEICCNKNNLTHRIIIEMLDKGMSHYFIRLCTGENGPSYKGASFTKSKNLKNFENILRVSNFIENGRESNRVIDYNAFPQGNMSYDCEGNEMY
ncbi:E3 ubiquitin-protein ligase TRIM50, partial [Armadillidium vulgare]